jgi:hypothetical protein
MARAAAASILLLCFSSECIVFGVPGRYLRDAFTLRGAKQHARSTHEWRQKFRVDSAFERPVPYHTAVTTAFPTYTLMDESPDGHAVLYTRVSMSGGEADCRHQLQTRLGSLIMSTSQRCQ